MAPPKTSSAVIFAAILTDVSSPYDRNPLAKAERNPLSWVPPCGVGTVLQYEFRNPSSSAGHATAHSTRPWSAENSTLPENGLGVTVRRLSSVDPKIMGIGPVPAIRQILERNNLTPNDIDVYEVNEAFASQALAVAQQLELPRDRLNPNGSGISLGHPIGATGAVITVKALYELSRIKGRYAVVSLCIGGGQGIAALFERT